MNSQKIHLIKRERRASQGQKSWQLLDISGIIETREDSERFLLASNGYLASGDLARVDSILQVSASANKNLFELIYKEDPTMCQALMDIMKDDIARVEEKRVNEKTCGKSKKG